MARYLRIEYEDAYYHITARGNERRNIFLDDFDKEMFLNILQDAYDKFGFIIHAFVLMDNHYHFLIQTPRPNLSASMRQINAVYTQAFNKRHKRVGHLFQGRFKSIIVDKDEYYLELIRYIHLNPARVHKDINAYRYSSHKAIMDKNYTKKWGKWYERGLILKEFDKKENLAIKKYKNYLSGGKDKESPLKKVIGGYALGDKKFANWLWENFIDGREGKDIVSARKLSPQIDHLKIVSVIAKEFGVKKEEVFNTMRGKSGENIVRGMGLHIIYNHTEKTQQELGIIAGGMNASAVSANIRRFGKLLTTDKQLKQIYDRVLSLCK